MSGEAAAGEWMLERMALGGNAPAGAVLEEVRSLRDENAVVWQHLDELNRAHGRLVRIARRMARVMQREMRIARTRRRRGLRGRCAAWNEF